MASLKLKPGVITGDALLELFAYCKKADCALPAVNVIGSHGANAALAAAREAKAPVIVQLSHTGSQFYGGKTLDNSAQKASIAGSIAGALHVRAVAEAYGVPVVLHTDHCAKKLLPWVDGVIEAGEAYYATNGQPLLSSHMLDLSEQPIAENLEISRKYLARISKMKMTLEIELGVTGGEEDGVDNSGVEHSKLYTHPEDVLRAYDVLGPVGSFTVAASFGNTHGVYAPGNVKLKPSILRDSQEFVKKTRQTGDEPLSFVFHGGSGSTPEEIAEAVSYGVVKMNIDTDTQYAYTRPIAGHMLEHYEGVLRVDGGVGDKKAYDPRAWGRKGEKSMAARVAQACRDLGSARHTLATRTE